MKFSQELTNVIGMPAYLNDGSEDAPTHPTYVVIGKNGIWKFHQDKYLSSCVKMSGIPRLQDVDVKEDKPSITWHGPKLPTKTFWFVRDYFISAWKKFNSEFDIQLWYSESLGKFLLRVPKQTISAASVDWELTDNDPWYVDEVEINKKDVPKDVFHIGRMHSHNEMSAFWSGTDTHDQVTQEYGIQIVLGKITTALEYRCAIAYNGRTVQVDILDVLTDPLIPRVQEIVIPSRCVAKPASTFYSNYSYGGTYGHYENGVWVQDKPKVGKGGKTSYTYPYYQTTKPSKEETEKDDEETSGITVISGGSPSTTDPTTKEGTEAEDAGSDYAGLNDVNDYPDLPDTCGPFRSKGRSTAAQSGKKGGKKTYHTVKVSPKAAAEFAKDPSSMAVSESEYLFAAASECAKQLISCDENAPLSKDTKWILEAFLDEFPSDQPIVQSLNTDPELAALFLLSCTVDWLRDELPFEPSEGLNGVFNQIAQAWTIHRKIKDVAKDYIPATADGAFSINHVLSVITRFAALISEINLCINTPGEPLYDDDHRDIVSQVMHGSVVEVSQIPYNELLDTLKTLSEKVSVLPALFFFLCGVNTAGLMPIVTVFNNKEKVNA